MEARTLFFEDLAKSMDYWLKTGVEAVSNENADLGWTDDPDSFRTLRSALGKERLAEEALSSVVRNTLRAFACSLMTTFDGGTELAEHCPIAIVDEQGNLLGDDLSADFLLHLSETKRMR